MPSPQQKTAQEFHEAGTKPSVVVLVLLKPRLIFLSSGRTKGLLVVPSGLLAAGFDWFLMVFGEAASLVVWWVFLICRVQLVESMYSFKAQEPMGYLTSLVP